MNASGGKGAERPRTRLRGRRRPGLAGTVTRGLPGAGLALFLAVAAVGCGSGSGDGGSATKADFIKQANEICNRANEELRAAVARTFPPDEKPDDETGIRFTRTIWVPNLREQLRDLRRLELPPADRDRIESMFDQLERVTDRVEADPSLANRGPFDRVTRRLHAYGIGPCGSP